MNLVIVSGNIAGDPSYRNDDHMVLSVPFAVENAVKKEDSSYDTELSCLHFAVLDKHAQTLDWLRKRLACNIQAHIKVNTFEKDGETIYTTDFIGSFLT